MSLSSADEILEQALTSLPSTEKSQPVELPDDLQSGRRSLRIRRVVSIHDQDRMRGMVRRAHEESRYGSAGWSEERYEKQFERLIRNQDSTLTIIQITDELKAL